MSWDPYHTTVVRVLVLHPRSVAMAVPRQLGFPARGGSRSGHGQRCSRGSTERGRRGEGASDGVKAGVGEDNGGRRRLALPLALGI